MGQVVYQLILSLDVIVAVLRLLPYLSVSRPFGVLVIIVEQMTSDLLQFLQLFIVVVVGFSLACTGLADGDIKVFYDGVPSVADAHLGDVPLRSDAPLGDAHLQRRALKGGIPQRTTRPLPVPLAPAPFRARRARRLRATAHTTLDLTTITPPAQE